MLVLVREKVSVWFDDDVTFEGSVNARRDVLLSTNVHACCHILVSPERIDDTISLLDVRTNVVDLNDDVDCLVMETDVNVHVDAHVTVNDQPF